MATHQRGEQRKKGGREDARTDTNETAAGLRESRDPMSGYASADDLAPAPEAPVSDQHENGLRDPMSGYASGDELDRAPEPTVSSGRGHQAEERDPLSGYASADLLERKDE